MTVADNGVGIFPGCRRKANSFGLVGIKERVSTLGGTMTIETEQDIGTTLIVSIPLSGPESSGARPDGFTANRQLPMADRRASDNRDDLDASVKRPVAARRKKTLHADKLNEL